MRVLASKLYASTVGVEVGSPIRRTEGRIGWGINTPWTKETDPQTGRMQRELSGDMMKGRFGGSLLDPEEWRRSSSWREWMPDRSLAKSLLLVQAGIIGAAGVEGAVWEGRRKLEFDSEDRFRLRLDGLV